MKFDAEGDSGVMVRWPASNDPSIAAKVLGLHRRLLNDSPEWLREAVPGQTSLLIVYDPIRADPGTVESTARKLGDAPQEAGTMRIIKIPVVYGGADGPDLERVAEHTGLSPADVIARHVSGRYKVAFMGFSPGFAYLTGMQHELSSPRLKAPRPRVPAGSVAVAAGQTAIYPGETAGGWNIIGRTAAHLVDWDRPDPFLLHPGDRVTFERVMRHAAECETRETTHPPVTDPILELTVNGLMSSLQDLGRGGHAHEGVPLSGAMDRIALRLANLAAGNPEGVPAVEFTFPAPRIRFLSRASFAIGGGDFEATLGGRPIPHYERIDARAGEELVFPRRRAGHWGYLALAGGVAARRHLGSASTDTRSGISRRLSPGARLGLDAPPAADGRKVPRELAALPGEAPVVRFIPGEDPAAAQLDRAEVLLSAMQDRAGYRSDSPSFPAGTAVMASEGIPPGTIQLPPDGHPIFLMADRPTTGGYAKLAFFASIDTRVIAQSPPGAKLKFQRITGDEARRLIREARETIDEVWGSSAG